MQSVTAYVEGTTVVKKRSVTRHLEGEGHRIALSIEKSKPDNHNLTFLTTFLSMMFIVVVEPSAEHLCNWQKLNRPYKFTGIGNKG